MRLALLILLVINQAVFTQWFQLGENNGLPGNSENILSIGVIGDRFIIGTSTNGIYISDDNGNSWRKPNGTEPPDNTNLIVAVNNRLIAGSAAPNQGVFISDDNGENWSVVNNGLAGSSTRILSVVNDKIYLSGNGLYVSNDNGDNWQKVVNGLPVAGDPQGLTSINATYFCTWGNALVYKSSDGENWSSAGNNGLPTDNLQLFEIVSIDSTLLVYARNAGIYRSTDNGNSWNRIMGMNNYDKNTFDFFVHNGTIYAATSMFVYQSTDAGETWTEVDANFPKPINMTVLNANGSTLIAGQNTTSGGQLWKYTFSTTDLKYEDRIPEKLSLSQNFPNPFNPVTTISYSVPVSGHVTLTVYDMLGNEIRILVDESKNPGKYKVHFESGNLPSGIYFYRIKSNGKVKVRKMILLK